jgi:hypothetical protein
MNNTPVIPRRMPLPPELLHASPDDRNAAAKVQMKRGIALLSANNVDVRPKALNCFERALEICCMRAG